MLKKTVLLFWAAFSLLAADPEVEQKKIRTMQDFIDLEKTLKMTQMLDPTKSNYYLGLLYFSEHRLENGQVIRPDYEKALSFLEKSLDEGNILAAFNVAMIFLKKGKIDNAIFVLDMALDSLSGKTEKDVSTGAYLSSALASIVLDFKANDKEALGLARDHLKRYVTRRDIPSANYLLSQLYLREGNMELANKELSKACSSPKRPVELEDACMATRRR